MRKTVFLALVFLSLLSLVLGNHFAATAINGTSSIMPRESEIIERINGANAYNYDLELEKIALNHSISNYAFRSTGSAGASEAAKWIKTQFESLGLETSMESFEFTTWNLLSKPTLAIDEDGNASTTSDQKIIRTFQPEHYSWPTPEGGVFRDLVVLPLPESSRLGFGKGFINSTTWNAINTTGKIILIGREVRWSIYFQRDFVDKLRLQPPAAVVYTWWNDWMSFTPPMFSSIGGLPASPLGTYYWDLKIPVGWVSYEDGLWIREREKQNVNVSAYLTIPAVIGSGPHYNVVGKLKGSTNPEKIVIVSGHYDTVMTSGFCDNGAGTAGVIELARVFAQAAEEGLYRPEYTLLFVAFAGEELGFVGSINYMRQHEAEMKNVTAVINLDCIGSDFLEVTETFPNEYGLDLDEVVLRAAKDLGIKANSTEVGGSDQEAFRNPKMANAEYNQYWGLDAGISNATRVKASTMILSYPLFYNDAWKSGIPGWIHTEYDNSTSTSTLNWVEVDDLEAHIKVAALSVMRILSYNYGPSLSQVVTVTLMAGIVLSAAAFFQRSRVIPALKRTYNDILNRMEMKEFLLIAILTVLFLFTSYVMHTRAGRVEIIVQDFPSTATIAYYGYPFEMIGIQYSAKPTPAQWEWTISEMAENYKVDTLIFWDALFLNFILYLLLAFGLIYAVARLEEMYKLRKSK